MTDTISADFVHALMPDLREALREAASLALPFFRAGSQTSAKIWSKAGGSPVTEADVAVDTFLKIRLSQIVPAAAWLSEETADDAVRIGHDLVWIVDPIDGTRAFLSGHRDWSIAVALLKAGEPVIGFVNAPALGHDYEAIHGRGATRNGEPIGARQGVALPTARVTGPKPMIDRLGRGVSRDLGDATFERIDRIPSLALRVARVAEGSVDVGLVSSDARDWDLAAADLILREAGGSVCDMSGVATVYNRTDPVHGELVALPNDLRNVVVSAWDRGRS
ncbi:3'(2'),5'-bisphosphate nucleotidase CysQ [Methylobacterium sp. WL30]|jgi:myo-inositol-1(or 4)-monophosphatase|uniref:3'(2'),5'-bisphosphate nucleotidase CysQ n=1 Tax=unclassified Methylobacterium TaxID=2615210 RepID=UPI0011C7381D|nr:MULTISPECIES: 3'(2'),5'-bisphosphate nucleotidase CysQ [unclassified Methylobacterium]MCJ2076193.1 3'(2'),5'-bisphosphate nucleotidase CysQ [Methylobacterium sp. E-016]TXM94059.1 3'(2'),5'-bisphosphate nucleotidase CysQ [Methylobacterium sp. WL116]TXN39320.1 3'(2'),5'-bisphosphate nucleotidase CysQ [Methylobacterium sp. WL93]TXN49750.1 3'(2'),5'-bisphosphate nucleotidase CysQ [Methylobacterium sp. WL119]TXN67291.1 3'(2'),5'-bisphosphate nucleotidase CysQ [Methylobacterium sp. WL30]